MLHVILFCSSDEDILSKVMRNLSTNNMPMRRKISSSDMKIKVVTFAVQDSDEIKS